MLFLDENGQPAQVADRLPTGRILLLVDQFKHMMVRAGTIAGEICDMPPRWGWPQATGKAETLPPPPPQNPDDKPADGWRK
jgi:hypothetical protein